MTSRPPSGKRWPRISFWALVAVAVAYAAYFLIDLYRIAPEILRADYLRIVYRMDKLLLSGDRFGLFQLITENQAGHTFIPYKIFALLNLTLFGWSVGLVKTLMIIALVLLGTTVGVIAVGRLRRHPLFTGLAAVFVAAVVYNFNGYDAQVWIDAALAIYPTVALSLVALWLLDRGLSSVGKSTRGYLFGAASIAALTIVWNGSGVAIIPAFLLLSVLRAAQPGARPGRVVVTGALAAGASVLPLAILIAITGVTATNSNATRLASLLEMPSETISVFFALLVWPLHQADQAAATLWGVGLAVLYIVFLLLALFRRLDGRISLWLAYAGYGACGAAAVALARTDYFLNLIKFIPSNYSVYTMPFVLGLGIAVFGVLASLSERAARPRTDGAPGSPVAATLGALAIVVCGLAVWQALALTDSNRVRAVGVASETEVAFQTAPNWSLFNVLRINGGHQAFALPLLLEALPSWAERGIVPSFSKDFVANRGSFRGATMVQDIAPAVQMAADPACDAKFGRPGVLYAARDTRMDLETLAPETPFAWFAGNARAPAGCKPADRIFLTDGDGRLICASKSHSRLQDFPQALRERLGENPHTFEFSCPMTEEQVRSGAWHIFGWVEAPAAAIVELPRSEL